MSGYNRVYPNPGSPGRRRPSLGQQVVSAPPATARRKSPAVAFMDAGPKMTTIPRDPDDVVPMAQVDAIRGQTAAARSLRQAIAANPLEAAINANPARQASIANQNRGIAAMQGIQQRLADSGNSQLGFGGAPAMSVADLVPPSPYGRSLMPGVVERGGVANVVGQLSVSDLLDDGVEQRAAAEAARKQEVAGRVAANNAAQLERNAGKLAEWGRKPTDNFTSGKQYVPGVGYQPISNFRAAQNAMSPDQKATFDEKRTARQADLDLRKQRQFARAQFREAAAGRGAIYQDDGGLDLTGTIATRMAATNAPTSMTTNRFGERSATYGNPSQALAALLGRDQMDETGRQFDGSMDLERDRLSAANDLADRRLNLDESRYDTSNEMARRQLAMQRRQFEAENDLAGRRLGLDEIRYGTEADLTKKRFELDQMRALEALQASEYDRGDVAHEREMQLAGIVPDNPIENRLSDAASFASLDPEARKPILDAAIAAVTSSPESAADILAKSGIDQSSLMAALEESSQSPNMFFLNDASQNASRDFRMRAIESLLNASGATNPGVRKKLPRAAEYFMPNVSSILSFLGAE